MSISILSCAGAQANASQFLISFAWCNVWFSYSHHCLPICFTITVSSNHVTFVVFYTVLLLFAFASIEKQRERNIYICLNSWLKVITLEKWKVFEFFANVCEHRFVFFTCWSVWNPIEAIVCRVQNLYFCKRNTWARGNALCKICPLNRRLFWPDLPEFDWFYCLANVMFDLV